MTANPSGTDCSISTLAVIPARGGSVGVPRKNARPLAGLPLIAHTIGQALAAERIDRVVVSTDDPEIGRIAERYGAEVVWRPDELSGPSASSESALTHVLEHLEAADGYRPDLLVFLQCTSPLTAAADIDGTIEALLDEAADTAVAVTPFHYFLWAPGDDGGAVGINHDKRTRPMRQDREPQYLETGAVYVMRTDGFREVGHRFFGKTAMHVTPGERRWEIDDPVDFDVAETLLARRGREEMLARLPAKPAALVMDFDGVFTDDRVWVNQEGVEAVACNRGDGLSLSLLRETGLPMVVISTEVNPVVAARCGKLNLPCLQGIGKKLPVMLEWLADHGLDLADTVYLGNDVNDLTCLGAVGYPVVVGDAHRDVRSAGRVVLAGRGGHGAVRELCDLLTERMGLRGT